VPANAGSPNPNRPGPELYWKSEESARKNPAGVAMRSDGRWANALVKCLVLCDRLRFVARHEPQSSIVWEARKVRQAPGGLGEVQAPGHQDGDPALTGVRIPEGAPVPVSAALSHKSGHVVAPRPRSTNPLPYSEGRQGVLVD